MKKQAKAATAQSESTRQDGLEHSAALSASDRRSLRSALLKWYDKHGRKLPWRASSDPYRIWLSEIMLQQTTVTAVVPYFERFLAAFPTVDQLAAADVDRVLRLWEGLGYYSRARNLHRAAKVVCEQHGGQFPSDVELLNDLPGVGRYTAGAIASFAFNLPAPIVEANTERLYARLIGLQEDVKSSIGQKRLWAFAESAVDKTRAGDTNQALMDVGSSLCTPTAPQCDVCPLARFCKAFQAGTQASIPVRKPRTTVTEVHEIAVAMIHHGRVLLRRRTDEERWAGMWDFARFELSTAECRLVDEIKLLVPGKSGKRSVSRKPAVRSFFEPPNVTLPDELSNHVARQMGQAPSRVTAAMEFKYSVTRYRVNLLSLLCEATKQPTRTKSSETSSLQWFPIDALESLPLSQTGRRIANWVVHQVATIRDR